MEETLGRRHIESSWGGGGGGGGGDLTAETQIERDRERERDTHRERHRERERERASTKDCFISKESFEISLKTHLSTFSFTLYIYVNINPANEISDVKHCPVKLAIHVRNTG